jgi:hypothetical protein
MSDSRAADELAIRGLVARYAEAVSSHNREQWAATWTEDGQWSVMGQTSVGRDDTVALWEKLMGGLEFIVQLANSGTVEFDENDGDRATGRWQITEHGKFPGGNAIFTIGFYQDECVRVDGEWRFKKRSFSPLYFGPPDLSAATHPFPTEE